MLIDFTTVYTEDGHWTNPKISGVGMIAPLQLAGANIDQAPIEVAARYDDP